MFKPGDKVQLDDFKIRGTNHHSWFLHNGIYTETIYTVNSIREVQSNQYNMYLKEVPQVYEVPSEYFKLVYFTNVIDNKVCQCGKVNHGFASHAYWCDIKD